MTWKSDGTGAALGVTAGAAFGGTCEEDGDWAYCVHFQCPDGDGNGSECLSETELRSCTDGWLSEGDCSVFGLECGEDAAGAGCMDARCASGPHSGFCIDAATAAQCTDGTYAETACAGDEVCQVDGLVAACVVPEEDDSGETDGTDGGGDDGGSDGGGDGSTGGSTGGSSGSGGTDGGGDGGDGEAAEPTSTSDDSGGCATVGVDPADLLGLLPLAAVLGLRRRRQPDAPPRG